MNFPAVSSRLLKVVVAVACLAVVLALLFFAGRTAQEGKTADENAAVAVSLADEFSAACSDPTQRTKLAEAGVSCAAIEKAAERADSGESVLIPGPRGADGPRGAPGADGDDGEDGDPGSRGKQGVVGSPGKAGEPGSTGPVGPPGPIGPDGDDGPPGPTGSKGIDGSKGDPGTIGADGATGPQGEKGEPGVQGETGKPGEPGEPGAPGSPGPAGPQGPVGADGAPGRGITSVSCEAVTPMSLTITYSDGTTETYTCATTAILRRR